MLEKGMILELIIVNFPFINDETGTQMSHGLPTKSQCINVVFSSG